MTEPPLLTISYWLSFADPDTGTFLGACVVDVTSDDAAAEVGSLHPNARPGAAWLSAAIRKAWKLKCNPGGEIAAGEVPTTFDAPRGRLMQKAELIERGLAAEKTEEPKP